jgi:hypothetical protein
MKTTNRLQEGLAQRPMELYVPLIVNEDIIWWNCLMVLKRYKIFTSDTSMKSLPGNATHLMRITRLKKAPIMTWTTTSK